MQGGENVRVIFGMKLKQFREQRGYSAKELAARTGVSTSYLTEIEKGKKYPKAEKIVQLAQALKVDFDDLVSLKLDAHLHPLTSLLDSLLMQEFPFRLFGITSHDIIELMTRSPQEAGSLVRTLGELATRYDVRVEQVLYAALRSYQETHQNYFADLEEAGQRFVREHQGEATAPVSLERLRTVLTEDYGYRIDETTLDAYPDLHSLRSVWVPGPPPRLLLNRALLVPQKAFVLGREVGYCYLRLKERAVTSSPIEAQSFAQVLNDFKASYFAGALLMPRDPIVAALQAFMQRQSWDGEAFLALLQRYAVTPEMLLYRLAELLPTFLQLQKIHFLRIHNRAGSHSYHLTKHLNMSPLRIPHGLGLHEHYCRRWLSVRLLRELHAQKTVASTPLIGVQRSHFLDSQEEYLCIALARPLILTPDTYSSVTIGFFLDETARRTIHFWDDPAIPRVAINETCERCLLAPEECQERVAPPTIYHQEQGQEQRKMVLEKLLAAL